MEIEIRAEPFGSPVTRPLADAQQAEMFERHGEEGSGGEPDPRQFDHPNGVFLAAFVDGEPAGCAGVARYDDETGELKRMYVAPQHRGIGLGRRILRELEDAARGLGYTKIRLETGNKAPEAMSLYESHGYRPIEKYGPFVNDPKSRCYEREL